MSEIQKENEELLQKWDSGEPIPTLERGGIGPGYEQALQVLAIEILRNTYKVILPESEPELRKEWYNLCNETLRKHDATLGGMSGAQFNQSCWLAYQWYSLGPKGFLDKIKKIKLETILVSNFWPRVATPEKQPTDG